jgi:phosphate ABC transporter phosphate-binding protein
MRFLIAWLLFGIATATAQAPATRNIYVDSFGEMPGAPRLREQVITELRKSARFHVVTDRDHADDVLDGNGDLWVKGHYSMNPRERSLGDSVTVYAGYLSIELKDKKGETMWSYLATPHSSATGTGTDQVIRDLARLVVKKLNTAMTETSPDPPSQITQPVTLTGAGATFPFPVYQQWFDEFHKSNPNITVGYDPVGSEAGMMSLREGKTDFAGSDVMIGADEYFKGGKPMFLRFPSILGGVVPVYNLPGLPRELRFTPDLLADIFLGRIRKWNDPRILAVNRGLQLPDRDIAVVHRSDGSGTTWVFTDYLSKVSADWKSTVGATGTPKWPVGAGAEGNEGVAKAVRETPGAIGYVEYIYAIKNHMTYASVRNNAGHFVSPDIESILAAARGSSNRIAEDFQTSITNASAPDAYPISAFTWVVVPAKMDDAAKKRALKEFLEWMLGPGQKQASALGYVEIAPEVLLREQQALERY